MGGEDTHQLGAELRVAVQYAQTSEESAGAFVIRDQNQV